MFCRNTKAGDLHSIGTAVDEEGTVAGPAVHQPEIGTLGLGGRRARSHSEALTFYSDASLNYSDDQ